MKKWITALAVLAVLAGCTETDETEAPEPVDTEVQSMNGLSFTDRDFEITLRQTAGTGFEWMTVYQTDNVELGSSSFHVDYGGEPRTGGSGDFRLAGRITNDEDAVLILKYARPWEGEGDYMTYIISSDQGRITDVKADELRHYTDCEFIHTTGTEIFVRTYLPKSWISAPYAEGPETGFRIHPEGTTGSLCLFHTGEDHPEETISGTKQTILIRGREYTMITDEQDETIMYLYGPDHLGCRSEDAAWWPERFLDIIRILDNSAYEE